MDIEQSTYFKKVTLEENQLFFDYIINKIFEIIDEEFHNISYNEILFLYEKILIHNLTDSDLLFQKLNAILKIQTNYKKISIRSKLDFLQLCLKHRITCFVTPENLLKEIFTTIKEENTDFDALSYKGHDKA